MSSIKEFDIGDWIITNEGICQVLGSQKYVVEEFFRSEYPSLEIGDVFDNKVVYKIFCDFECKPRKTKFINYYSSEWCDPIDKEYGKIKNKAINENAEAYKRFKNRKIEKPIYSRVEFSIRVEPKKKKEIIEDLNNLLTNLSTTHDFEYLQNLIYSNVDGIISDRLTNNDTLQTNVLIAFTYNILEANSNKFAFLSGKAVGTYCADDQESL